MLNWFNDLPQEIQATLLGLVTTIVGLIGATLVAWFKEIKVKAEVRELESEHKLAVLKLESEKALIQEQMIQGSYVICSKCGEKILLSDMVFKYDKKN